MPPSTNQETRIPNYTQAKTATMNPTRPPIATNTNTSITLPPNQRVAQHPPPHPIEAISPGLGISGLPSRRRTITVEEFWTRPCSVDESCWAEFVVRSVPSRGVEMPREEGEVGGADRGDGGGGYRGEVGAVRSRSTIVASGEQTTGFGGRYGTNPNGRAAVRAAEWRKARERDGKRFITGIDERLNPSTGRVGLSGAEPTVDAEFRAGMGISSTQPRINPSMGQSSLSQVQPNAAGTQGVGAGPRTTSFQPRLNPSAASFIPRRESF